MEPYVLPPRTPRRLERAADAQGLDRSDVLDPALLAARTALPGSTVRDLLDGRTPPHDTVPERGCGRLKALSDACPRRHGKLMKDLAADVSRSTGISDVWARAVCDGRKTPNVELLHHPVGFFGVDGGGSFFTAPRRSTPSRPCWTGTAW